MRLTWINRTVSGKGNVTRINMVIQGKASRMSFVINNFIRKIAGCTLICCTTLVTGMSVVGLSVAGMSVASADAIADGKKLAFSRRKGNCLACHMIAGGSLPGDIGPPLIAMKSRFPDKADLRLQIWDATIGNPNTIMPPFGKHLILTEKEVDLVTEFIYNL